MSPVGLGTENRWVGKGQQQFSSQLVGWWVSELVREPLVFSFSELLMWGADIRGQGQFENPEEAEGQPLEAATKQRLMKILTDWEDLVCLIVIC
jgi:hypothetical protein